jgi:DNA-binding NarL/FixJ family response regulator
VVAAEPLLRTGLAAALEEDGRSFAVLGTAGTLKAAQQLFAALRPALAVVVVEPALPDATMQSLCSTLIQGRPATATLALLRSPGAAAVRLVGRSGARGLRETTVTPEQLRLTLRQIESGEIAIEPAWVGHLLAPAAAAAATPAAGEPAPHAPDVELTNRELVALQLLARGYSSKQMAALLQTTAKAIDMAVERATRRLGARHRTQAVAAAMKRGLIS